jgi:transglutaminase-like putative cysteine protease
MLDREVLEAPALDHHSVDLNAADRVTYLLEQTFSYDYPAPVRRLRQRLVVLPPARHGGQHLRAHRLEVHGTRARRVTRRDTRGNTVVRFQAERVERGVHFWIGALLERVRADGPVRLPADALSDPRLQRPTPLTAADPRLRDLASDLSRGRPGPLELADRICQAVHSAITYQYGVTSIRTTAGEALEGGRGVCQDSSHIMLALCHVLGLPARYASGHLLGHGGTHAWVEVVIPRADHAVAMPFDPCNGVPASSRYLTVAVGRDYRDVAPTSGSYLGTTRGHLTTTRRAVVLAAA